MTEVFRAEWPTDVERETRVLAEELRRRRTVILGWPGLVLFLVASVFGVLAVILNPGPLPGALLTAAGLGLVIWIVNAVLLPVRIRALYRAALPADGTPQTARLDADGVELTGGGRRMQYPWGDWNEVEVRGTDLVLLRTQGRRRTPVLLALIPLGAFNAEAEVVVSAARAAIVAARP